ncbi:MAG: LLM class flavin-dependent oxidoreductase [Mycobacterium sp.]|uniref:LLM class flavin-dependent oxidoreductase n=1 Tax=Mycobacterium sp. TaxID=1785 RepID=UPI003BAFD67B
MALQSLGPVGVCLPVSFAGAADAVAQREAIAQLEHAGYQAIWTNEVIGKDAFVQLGVLLAATERMVFGTCIRQYLGPACADHITLLLPIGGEFAAGIDQLERLAPALALRRVRVGAGR